MKVSQYLVKKLIEHKVTDVFGIPGGVILDFIYELDKNDAINVHLSYHEQAAAYAACGYAQSSGKLGVAYATKGPGVTNMITAIAEAYYDSLPVLFVTAHSQGDLNSNLRIEEEQEIDHSRLTNTITKYSKRVDTVEEAIESINWACREAISGRKGPVLLDFSVKVLKSEIEIPTKCEYVNNDENESIIRECTMDINRSLKEAKRPIFLIGDGVRSSGTGKDIAALAGKYNIPILSSRFSQDIVAGCDNYFGYIGSHGLRYSNFILSKTDCIISFGNRMAFPVASKSFRSVIERIKIIRIDVDASELDRNIPNSHGYCIDLTKLFPILVEQRISFSNDEWLKVCGILKEKLRDCDVNSGVLVIAKLINMLKKDETIVCDIGNNELLVSRAYSISGNGRKMLHSKAFKTVGSAIGKAIGAYYKSRKKVLCIVGDQGIQFNIQELQYISNHDLPIVILIWNNNASEMLKDSEKRQGYKYDLHTTLKSGYSHPDFEKIANAYGIRYKAIRNLDNVETLVYGPQIIEMLTDECCSIQQYLPKGYPCQRFIPEIDIELYNYLDNL